MWFDVLNSRMDGLGRVNFLICGHTLRSIDATCNVKNRDNNDLMEQMERSEMLLQEKEKDLNHMKFVFKDLEKKVDFLMQRNELLTEEVESLKLKNKLEEEVKQIKEREEISRN